MKILIKMAKLLSGIVLIFTLAACGHVSSMMGGSKMAGSDKAITSTIQAALVASPTVPERGINVTSSQGHVTLSGYVFTQAEKDAAGQIASKTPGVSAVNNTLSVTNRGHAGGHSGRK